jgi:ABC-2 type transport system ATP-binding protein
MRKTIFAARDVSKKYGSLFALNHVNMEIRRGDIYGFVGENGAGKTTLIRILSGLAYKTAGEITLFGSINESQLVKERQRIGFIVEAPAIYPDLSAEENLEICRLQRGIPGKSCLADTLKIVQLNDTGTKKAKHFSLGMKQRLGLAMSLLGNPELLVLDEPTNGLDPVGIRELRELLRKLNREHGITILISSHILGELYQLATCYGFIHCGKLLEQITQQELNERCKKHLFLRVGDTARAAAALETKLFTTNYEVLPNNVIRLYDYLDSGGKVAGTLFEDGVVIEEITAKGDNLENYYIRLIGGEPYA